MTQALIGVDIGTQGTKAGLFDENGKCLAETFRPSKLYRPKPGVVEEDPENQVKSVCSAIKACVRESGIAPESAAGIGIDGQMAGVIGVGADGKNVTPYDSWLDTRCAPYIHEMRARAGKEILDSTGCPPSINHGPKKLWWKKEHPETYSRIQAFVQPGGYAVMRLCGLDGTQAFIDTTYLHFSGFADNRKGAWNEKLCKTFKLDPEKLPAIVKPEAIMGELTGAAARRCGLKAGVPIVAGCGDTAASFLACGATREGVCVDVAGTASVFASTTKTFQPDHENQMLGCGHSAVPGLWHPYAYINGGGMNLEWFRRELLAAGCKGEAFSFNRLNRLASRLEAAGDDPLFVPHFGGRVCPGEPEMRGAWAGLNWNHSAAHLYRAILESVALEYAIYRDVLCVLYPEMKIRELRITGGGEKSDLWNGIKSDVLAMPVRRVNRSEGAPLGAALVAGYGAGVVKNLATAANKWISAGDRLKPDRKMTAHYSERAARYARLIEAIREI
jgi:xylulokinase